MSRRLLPNGQLTDATRHICQSVDGLIYVVDAEKIATRRDGTIALVDDDTLTLEMHQVLRATRQRAPVPFLVLSASSSGTCTVDKASVVDVASGLQLGAASRQWRVEAIAVENMAGGLHRGCEWLLGQM